MGNILSFEKLKNMNNPSYVEFDQLDATKLNTLDSGQSEHQHRAVTIEPLSSHQVVHVIQSEPIFHAGFSYSQTVFCVRCRSVHPTITTYANGSAFVTRGLLIFAISGVLDRILVEHILFKISFSFGLYFE